MCPPSSPTHLQTCSSPSPGLCPYCASIPHTVGSLKGAFFLPNPHLDLGAPKVQNFSASVLASTCWHSRGKALIIHQPELNLALSLSSIHGGRNSNVCWANGIDLACCSHPARTEALSCLLVRTGSRTRRRDCSICAQPCSHRTQGSQEGWGSGSLPSSLTPLRYLQDLRRRFI